MTFVIENQFVKISVFHTRAAPVVNTKEVDLQ